MVVISSRSVEAYNLPPVLFCSVCCCFPDLKLKIESCVHYVNKLWKYGIVYQSIEKGELLCVRDVWRAQTVFKLLEQLLRSEVA